VAPRDPEPGRTSIEGAFEAVYGDAPRSRRAPAPADRPPTPGAVLHGIDAYRGADHWHLVTVGLTDIARKTPGSDPDRSGLGHELTLIVPGAEHAPVWAFELLMGMARTSAAVGRPFHAGARLAPGAPVDGGGSGLVAVGVRPDPLVVPESFPFGAYEHLQAVGVTNGEYLLMQRAGTLKVLERLALKDPLLRTDPARA
jgi:hypothetical protein